MATEETATIDENNIAVKCTSLEALAAECRLKLSRIEYAYERLTNIRRKTAGVNPKDTRTGTTMSDATRLEIYNSAIALASELLEIDRVERENRETDD